MTMWSWYLVGAVGVAGLLIVVVGGAFVRDVNQVMREMFDRDAD